MEFLKYKDFLEEKVHQYNTPQFIQSDPIQIPHLFSQKEDIEIAGFLIATIAWGNRKSIINNGKKLVELMGSSPYDYVMSFDEQREKERLSHFVHRTLNAEDLNYFLKALQHIYTRHEGMEAVFKKCASADTLQPAIHEFKNILFELPHLTRTLKHVSDPLKNSAAKRINMFLRWMVRKDKAGVDFGIWSSLNAAQLSCPLDVHSGRVARKLGLLKRKQNDAKSLQELDNNLRIMDLKDPVKFDYALFGLGIFENF